VKNTMFEKYVKINLKVNIWFLAIYKRGNDEGNMEYMKKKC